ncbi:MAG: hypothetical protein GDA52_00490 [Rhodobacteraceae bacterium]|nr:hypothetical protein [Paracoccaceae bacterium]
MTLRSVTRYLSLGGTRPLARKDSRKANRNDCCSTRPSGRTASTPRGGEQWRAPRAIDTRTGAPEQAANLLNVAPQYLDTLIEQGVLKYANSGIRCHLALADVVAYKAQRSRARRAALLEMQRISEDLGAG